MNKIFYYLVFLFLLLSSCKKDSETNYLLSLVSKNHTKINFQNTIKDTRDYNIVNYLYYYNGGGVAVGDINNDNLPDIYFVSNKESNKLYLNKGDLKFEDVTNSSGVGGNSDWNTGVTMVDINNDGYLDIYVCSVSGILDFEGENELFVNNGDGTFTEKAEQYGLNFKGYSTQAYFFDYDKDNDLDVYIVNHAVHTKTSHGPALIREKRSDLTGDVLFKNENGKFIDASEEAKIFGGVNGYGLSASIADFNNDGWEDIYVCNDFHEDDYYYLNNQDGTFTESLGNSFSTISRFSMGSDAGDLNADGFQDIVTLDMLPYNEKVLKESEGDVSYNIQDQLTKLGYRKQYSRNMLQFNNNGEYFYEVGLFNGIAGTDWSWAPLIADFDQDGYQDLFVSNGIYKRPNNLDFMRYISSSFKSKTPLQDKDQWLINSLKEMPDGKVPNQIFKGNSKKFANKNGQWINSAPSLSNGAAYCDLDNDGDLDLILNNLNHLAQIFENTTNSNANKFIKLKFNYTDDNLNGIGTKAIVYTKGSKQMKQLFNSRGFASSVNNTLHFGLGKVSSIDSILVIWPNNTFQKVSSPKINSEVVVKYDLNASPYSYTQKYKSKKLFLKNNKIDFVHKEDNYNDFNYEKLIPYKVSTAGPALAIGDIDNNGFEDLFIGNSSGVKAQLYLNDGNDFIKKEDLEIEKDSLYEDIDAVFFDFDGDSDLDLYVATGINSNRNSSYELDRLYLNDGKGNFQRRNNILENSLNSSTVKAYDYDQDGDIDLFVGNRSNPNDFGQTVESYILDNDGQGNFTKNVDFKLKSKVTDAIWRDINNDGIKDLLISTEWDQPKIFINDNGILDEIVLNDNLNGLWQTISSYDIDNDGDQDIMLGNWGLNTKFQPKENSALRMYHSDFNNDGKNETVLAYKIGNNYYPVNSKDELASQMNFISRRFVKYKDYAYTPIENILTKEAIKLANIYEVNNMASGYLLNNNGKFEKFIEFPDSFQYSPIMTFFVGNFDNDVQKEMLITGNFNGLNTYHGSFNALNGFLINKAPEFDYKFSSDIGLNLEKSQIRKLKSIKMKNSELLFALSNNDSLKMFTNNNVFNEKE